MLCDLCFVPRPLSCLPSTKSCITHLPANTPHWSTIVFLVYTCLLGYRVPQFLPPPHRLPTTCPRCTVENVLSISLVPASCFLASLLHTLVLRPSRPFPAPAALPVPDISQRAFASPARVDMFARLVRILPCSIGFASMDCITRLPHPAPPRPSLPSRPSASFESVTTTDDAHRQQLPCAMMWGRWPSCARPTDNPTNANAHSTKAFPSSPPCWRLPAAETAFPSDMLAFRCLRTAMCKSASPHSG